MSDSADPNHKQNPQQTPREREYEKSGMYPEDGKPFRMFALLGWLAAIVVIMAAAAAIMDYMLI